MTLPHPFGIKRESGKVKYMSNKNEQSIEEISSKRNWSEIITTSIKWLFLAYVIIVLPSVFFGRGMGFYITMFLVIGLMIYRKNEERHRKREEYLKDARNSGMSEEAINSGLKRIDDDFEKDKDQRF